MKYPLSLLLISLLIGFSSCKKDPVITPGENNAGTYFQTLSTPDGNEREYIVYVPASASGTQKVPVLFMIHGTNQSGQIHYDNKLWSEKADEEGFIVVYPTALVYCHYDNGDQRTTTKWASGNLGESDLSMGAMPLCQGEVLADDMLFFDQLVDRIQADFAVDEKRIYVSGFSNGAQMAARLAAERSQVFAAVAVHAGDLSQFIPRNLSPRPLSMMITVGAADGLFLNAVGVTPPLPVDANAIEIQGIKDAVQPFLTINGLDSTYSYSSSVYFQKTIADFSFENSTAGQNNRVRFRLIEDLGHSYTAILIDPLWDFLSGESLD